MKPTITRFAALLGAIPASERPRKPKYWPLMAVLAWVALNLPALVFAPRTELGEYRGWQLLAGAVVITVALALYSSLPLVSLSLCTALWWSVGLAYNDVGAIIISPYLPAVFIMSYTVGRLPVSPRAVLCTLGLVVLAESVATALVGLTAPMWAVLVTGLIFAGLLPWLLGRYSRQRHELQHAGWEHARQVEQQQRSSVEQARLRERTRIAEDMHDSLGHELSLLALRAGALQVAPNLDDNARRTAAELRAGAAGALQRLRDIIGVLREEDTPAPMDPWHMDVDALVERARASGVLVTLERTGEVGELPSMTDKALYRVVQESLTNTIKHAPKSRVTVRLDYTPEDVRVTVRNGPPSRAPQRDRPQGRRGLIGLDERTRLVGGEFHAAPLADGGFEVRARLSRDSHAVRPAGNQPVAPPESPSSDGLTHAANHLRRRFLIAVSLPAGLFVCVAVAMLGYYAYLSTSSVLPPHRYEQLAVGDSVEKVDRLLPDNEMQDPPSEYRPEPPGASCRYYRASEDLFVRVDVYRLCFADKKLVEKSVITAESRAPIDHG
ncbi:sensor histidine kinase [Streptomyces sp. MAD19A]|uniref:sensor histidine kinase n=1 Tax=Streptomyces sp. MAD19A TaxID=3242896 RepID=UPI0035298BDA